ncbi:hypothetical protein ACFQZE_24005 [Paenibacillus sp. GCM10027627]|uniref:hypothetical protein n=1 Tax=unclassified Paenibacillus TaxID=185978 RepID=UPI00362BE15F
MTAGASKRSSGYVPPDRSGRAGGRRRRGRCHQLKLDIRHVPGGAAGESNDRVAAASGGRIRKCWRPTSPRTLPSAAAR